MATSQLHEDFSREEHVKAGSDRGFGVVGWPYRLALDLAAGDRLPGRGLHFSEGPQSSQQAVAEIRPAALQSHEPHRPGVAFLRDHHADRPRHARHGQGLPAPASRSHGQELLDRSHAAGAAAAIHEKPILILKGPAMGSIIVELWAFMRERKNFGRLAFLII